MKKFFLSLIVLATGYTGVNAQINKGGLPLSLTSGESALSGIQPSKVLLNAPDLTNVLREDASASLDNPKPYRTGKFISSDISFPQSGTFVTLADGRIVWRMQMTVSDAPGIGLYFDQFQLPAGVSLYITNSNNKQVLGAYTADNNNEDGLFATQTLQGNVANIEIDINKDVDMNAIKMHINQVAYMYRGTEYLSQYANNNDDGIAAKPTDDPFIGESAICEINAICPQGTNFANSRKATVRILMPVGQGYVGLCTGTLVNNTKGDCTPYVLTASHCNSTNSKTNTEFSQFIYYFNFEATTCAGTTASDNMTMVGSSFVARSDYDSTDASLIGDFLLLKLNTKVPTAYGVYFAGWNRATTLSTTESFIGFHHPDGDMKKLAVGTGILPNGTFNQATTTNTHWRINFTTGGIEHGSSGSGLFDSNGRLVGDLSGAPPVNICTTDTRSDITMSNNYVVYSKFTRNWEYPEGNGATNAQLKTWLDPTGVDATVTNSLAAAAVCNAPTTGVGISLVNEALNNGISIYPNPVINSNIHLKINLDKKADLSVVIYDVTGARKATYSLNQVINGEYNLNVNGFANGAYLVNISNGETSVSKKVMIMK